MAFPNHSPGLADASVGRYFRPREEAAVFKNLNINYFSCIPAYNQMGAAIALESPLSAIEIARMCDAFASGAISWWPDSTRSPAFAAENQKARFTCFQISPACVRNSARSTAHKNLRCARSSAEQSGDAGADVSALAASGRDHGPAIIRIDRFRRAALSPPLDCDRTRRSSSVSSAFGARHNDVNGFQELHPGRQTPMLTDLIPRQTTPVSPEGSRHLIRSAARRLYQRGRSHGGRRRPAR